MFAHTIAFGLFASSHTSFSLDEISQKFLECFDEDLPELAIVSLAEGMTLHKSSSKPSYFLVMSYKSWT